VCGVLWATPVKARAQAGVVGVCGVCGVFVATPMQACGQAGVEGVCGVFVLESE